VKATAFMTEVPASMPMIRSAVSAMTCTNGCRDSPRRFA
jgi:hypothetical protein